MSTAARPGLARPAGAASRRGAPAGLPAAPRAAALPARLAPVPRRSLVVAAATATTEPETFQYQAEVRGGKRGEGEGMPPPAAARPAPPPSSPPPPLSPPPPPFPL